MPRTLIPLVWAFTLWNLIAVFFGTQIVFRANSIGGDLICGMVTLSIVLFGVATVEIREAGKHPQLRYLRGFVLGCGFIFAVVGNFSFLPRLFHSPETAFTPRAIFWDEMFSSRGFFIFVFTLICSMFATMHGRLPRGRNPLAFFRHTPPTS
jgi:hypothetical protein